MKIVRNTMKRVKESLAFSRSFCSAIFVRTTAGAASQVLSKCLLEDANSSQQKSSKKNDDSTNVKADRGAALSLKQGNKLAEKLGQSVSAPEAI